MYYDRHIQLTGKLKLGCEHLFLSLSGIIFIVPVETALPYSLYPAAVHSLFPDDIQPVFRHISGIFRMYPRSSIEIAVLFRKNGIFLCITKIRGGQHGISYSLLRENIKKLISVLIKGMVGIVGMRIEYIIHPLNPPD